MIRTFFLKICLKSIPNQILFLRIHRYVPKAFRSARNSVPEVDSKTLLWINFAWQFICSPDNFFFGLTIIIENNNSIGTEIIWTNLSRNAIVKVRPPHVWSGAIITTLKKNLKIWSLIVKALTINHQDKRVNYRFLSLFWGSVNS